MNPTPKAFDVMLNGTRINTVFEPKFRTEESVRRYLVERMQYDPEIVVVDVARQFQNDGISNGPSF
jgi:aspartyl/asparaginyl-tRNA synthetase